MIRPSALAAALLLTFTAFPAHAAMLADSTVTDTWKLANGLEVRTRHVPGAAGVAATLAFRAGWGYEPAGREGQAELLAELEFSAPAGTFPERTRAEMPSLRPLGWDVRTGSRLVRFTEIGTAAQLPGMLQQSAARLAGVTLTDVALKAAIQQVRRDAGKRYFGEPADVLYWRSAGMALGWNDEQIVRHASLPGLDKLTVREVSALLTRYYQPGNASLALAGDLSGLDVHALVDAAFGGLRGGEAVPDTVALRLSPVRRAVPWKDLAAPIAVIAAQAPALSDTLHPAFYLGMLLTGPALTRIWGAAAPPLVTRFQYSLFDDPELVRFYPGIAPTVSEPDYVSGALYEQLQVVGGQVAGPHIYDRVRFGVRWLLGAELPPEVQQRLRSDAGGLGTLSGGMAARALWLGDGYWAGYLARFDRLKLGHEFFYDTIAEAAHQSVLLLTPAK